jgi:hypothetical protein
VCEYCIYPFAADVIVTSCQTPNNGTWPHESSQDNNGSIENEELKGFLKDLLELVKKVRL